MSMEILKKLYIAEKPQDLPISFNLDGKEFYGIPENYDTKVEVEEKGAVRRTTFTGVNESGLEIKVVMTTYTDFPVVEYVTCLTNKGGEKTDIIDNLYGYNKTFEGFSPYLTHGSGDTRSIDGFEMKTDQLLGPIIVESKGGMGAFGASPFMRLMTKDHGLNIAIGWPGDWSFTATNESLPGKYALKCCQKYFRTYILPGETMRTPSITLMAFEGDESIGRNLWRRFYFAHIIPKPLSPVYCIGFRDSECTEWSSTTQEHQLDAINKLEKADMLPDLWWIDAGWYECTRKWYMTGTWKVNRDNWPEGLGKLGKLLKEKGIGFLLWFEPERITQDTELWNEHPDWLIKKNEGEHATLNLGIKECLDWITERFDSIIKEAGVTVYRQDINHKDFSTFWALNDEVNREGSTENLCVQGYLKLWDNLLERNPGLLIDSCAGGGRRNEMEALRRSVAFHYTDIGYGVHPIKQKQHRYMFEWIPYFRASTLDWRNENNQYQYFPEKAMPLNPFSLHNALAPTIWPTIGFKTPDDKIKLVKVFMKIWRKAADLMLKGDYYPLTECKGFTDEVCALQFDDPETKTGFIQVINNVDNKEDTFTFCPKFNENAAYSFELADGNAEFEIKDNKFNVKIKKGCASIWFYNY